MVGNDSVRLCNEQPEDVCLIESVEAAIIIADSEAQTEFRPAKCYQNRTATLAT